MFAELVKNNRSYRRFYQEASVELQTLRKLVALTRYCPSAANLQPLKYILSCDAERNALIFDHLAWAAYLKDWKGPQEGEKPPAYIIVLQDTTIAKSVDCDHGIACQTILLGATEKGLGGCIIGAVKRKELHKAMSISNDLKILLVLAIGKPKETVVIDSVKTDESIKYWRDSRNVHHVPKRSLDEVIVG